MAVFLTLAPALGDDSEPLRVLAQAAPGKHYVGEAIDFAVAAFAEGERPRIVVPRVAGAELIAVGTDLKPISASGIGDVVEEKNLFRYRFRLVLRRAGVIEVPPVPVRLGARSGASPPVRVTVQALPASGRPAEFLGGVGSFAVTAEARPATVRQGQALEYRIVVTGPAARGMTGAPALKRFAHVPLGLEVEPLTAEVIAEPPSRVFRYRVRPTRAGEATLPPVALAAFDPRTAQYVTKVTPGIPVRVVDVPRFQPSTLDYQPPAPQSRTLPGRTVGVAVATVGLAAALTLLGVRWTRGRRGDSARARRRARRLARDLHALTVANEIGRVATSGLTAYLNLTVGRAPGALTPDEARRGFADATGSADLGERAARLIVLCDQAQFGRAGVAADTLRVEALGFLEALIGC